MRPAAAKTKDVSLQEPVNLSGGSLEDVIRVRGARQHNLKNVDVTIPRNKMVVFTGVSGSGKSSLAFDTIFAEGQRRYVESLSAYARQFLGQVDKPDVDAIEGLSPAISIGFRIFKRKARKAEASWRRKAWLARRDKAAAKRGSCLNQLF